MKSKAAKSKMNSDAWCTGTSVAEPLEQFFDGPVGMDPCSNANSIINAMRALHAAGLHLSWTPPEVKKTTVYRNNPYSKSDPWIDKAIRELRKKERPVTEEVGLVMVSTSTGWWRRMCGVEPVLVPRDGKPLELWAPRARLLFTGRLKFRGDVGFGARFDTVLTYYGRRVREFEREFKHITKWSAWGEKR